LIEKSAKAKAIKMLLAGRSYADIEKATGVKNVTARSWNMKRLKGITSLSEIRQSCRYDSGAMYELAEINQGWDTAMALDLLRYKFTDFPRYFEKQQ
tara:strand:- start:525 stop:815 length:291 start_codon:yes stop_codon:yes gene_type:complete